MYFDNGIMTDNETEEEMSPVQVQQARETNGLNEPGPASQVWGNL